MKKMRFSNKGQAALEFIMTYGWAILVVLVAIGALAYFGVLSPDRLLPNKCVLQSGMGCTDFRVQAATITVRITNSLGYDVNAAFLNASNCPTTVGQSISNGGSATFVMTCDSDPVAVGAQPLTGTKYNADLNISYVVTDSGISHKNIGQLTARIE